MNQTVKTIALLSLLAAIVLPSTAHRGSGRRCQKDECNQMAQKAISKQELDQRNFKALQAELEKRQKDASKIQKVV